nr:MAG TPA: hypothetical protein [Caudoviricetes sp.]
MINHSIKSFPLLMIQLYHFKDIASSLFRKIIFVNLHKYSDQKLVNFTLAKNSARSDPQRAAEVKGNFVKLHKEKRPFGRFF